VVAGESCGGSDTRICACAAVLKAIAAARITIGKADKTANLSSSPALMQTSRLGWADSVRARIVVLIWKAQNAGGLDQPIIQKFPVSGYFRDRNPFPRRPSDGVRSASSE
jgi:hypothetical protein